MSSVEVNMHAERELALREIRRCRAYVENLIQNIDPDAWFVLPPGGVSTISWQVGHLAMAEYRLCLHRLRGVRAEDESLISAAFLEAFGRGSIPSANASDYPSSAEILSVFHAVHQRALLEVAAFPAERLGEPLEISHRLCETKMDALWWRVRHEMVHAGQLALLRRQLGGEPLW